MNKVHPTLFYARFMKEFASIYYDVMEAMLAVPPNIDCIQSHLDRYGEILDEYSKAYHDSGMGSHQEYRLNSMVAQCENAFQYFIKAATGEEPTKAWQMALIERELYPKEPGGLSCEEKIESRKRAEENNQKYLDLYCRWRKENGKK